MLDSVGQVYPRSLDLDVVAALVQAAAGPSSLATTLRLMAGHELVTEGFQPGQVGSSAMPHKMNTRSLRADQRPRRRAARPPGDGRASSPATSGTRATCRCSVVRRVALPDAFLATDGLFQTFLTVLDELGAYPAVIARELDRYLPFLATTKVLVAAVQRGVGREVAHEAIKEHASPSPSPCARRAGRRRRPARPAGRRRAARPRPGRARRPARRPPRRSPARPREQVARVCDRVDEVVAAHPEAAAYTPGAIL